MSTVYYLKFSFTEGSLILCDSSIGKISLFGIRIWVGNLSIKKIFFKINKQLYFKFLVLIFDDLINLYRCFFFYISFAIITNSFY